MTERPALRVIPRPSERADEAEGAEAGEPQAPAKKRATNPQVQAWNEKFSSDPGSPPLGDGPNRARDVLAADTSKGAKFNPKVAAGVVVALVLVGAFIAFGRSRTPAPVQETEEAVLLDEALAEEIDRRAAIPNVPSCWETDEGYRFEFAGKKGRVETVGTILEVPVLYRLQARCIRE